MQKIVGIYTFKSLGILKVNNLTNGSPNLVNYLPYVHTLHIWKIHTVLVSLIDYPDSRLANHTEMIRDIINCLLH